MSTHVPTRLIILAPATLYQAAWQALLSRQPDIEVVGAGGDMAGVSDKLPSDRPTTLLIDHPPPLPPLIQQFNSIPTNAGLLCLVDSYDLDQILPLLQAGASGCISRDEPVAELARAPAEPTASGWRGQLIGLCRKGLAYIQRSAPNAAAVNQGWRHDLANVLYHLIAWLAGGQIEKEWQAHRHHLTQQILELAQRDPGRRILVVVNVRHCHHIRPTLKRHSEVEVVPYSRL